MSFNERTPLLQDNDDAVSGNAPGIQGHDLHDPEQVDVGGGKPQVSMLTIMFPLSIGIFLAALDWMIVASSFAAIGSELNALQSTSWIATAYMLTTTSFQPLYGKLSDIFGRKSCLIFAYTIFAIGCLLCGMARNITERIAARAFSGIGGGGITTLATIIMSDVAPLRERGTWQGIGNMFFATGQAVGAPLGGVLADTIGWRWAFLLQVPIAILAIISVSVSLKLSKNDHLDFCGKLKRVDFLGGNVSWDDRITLTYLITFLVLFFAFLFVEMEYARESFAPKHILVNKTLIASYMCNFLSIGSQMALIYHASLCFQVVKGRTASQAGLLFLPGVAAAVAGSLGGGLIVQFTGQYYVLTVLTYALSFIGATIATFSTGILLHSDTLVVIGLSAAALGLGAGTTTTLIALIANAGPQDQGVATAVSYLFRSTGSVVAISVASTATQEALRHELYKRLSGSNVDEIINHVRKSLRYIDELPLETHEKVIASYAEAIYVAFWICASLYGISLLSSFFVKEKTLHK